MTGHIRGRKYCFSIHMLQKSGKDACPNNPAICCKFCDIKSACHDPCTGVDKYNICSAQITLEEYLIKLVGGSHL